MPEYERVAYNPGGLGLRAYSIGGVAMFNGHASLPTGLLSYWKLNEDSGTRLDSTTTGNNLTDNNTVTSEAKGVGAPSNMPATVATFTAANLEYLSNANPLIDNAVAYTYNVWFKNVTALGGSLLNVDNATNRPVNIDTNGVGGAELRYYVNGGGGGNLITGDVTLATWHMATVAYDPSTGANGTIYLYVDANAGTSVGLSAGMASETGLPWRIGYRVAFSDQPFNGNMSSAGLWLRVLTSQERTDLYASGNGLFF